MTHSIYFILNARIGKANIYFDYFIKYCFNSKLYDLAVYIMFELLLKL